MFAKAVVPWTNGGRRVTAATPVALAAATLINSRLLRFLVKYPSSSLISLSCAVTIFEHLTSTLEWPRLVFSQKSSGQFLTLSYSVMSFVHRTRAIGPNHVM